MLAIKDNIKKYVLIYFFLLCVHTASISVPIIGIVSGLMELTVLLHFALKNDLRKFLLCLCLIIPTCYDIPYFALGTRDGQVYSCVSLPFVEGHLFMIILFLPFFFNLKKILNLNSQDLKRYKKLYKITKTMLIFLFIGFFSFFFSFCINDNNIRNLNIAYFFVQDARSISASIVLILYFVFYAISYKDFERSLFELLMAFLITINITVFLFTLCGLRGQYGNFNIVLAPTSYIFSMTVLFFALSGITGYRRILTVIAFVVSVYMQLMYSNALGGKSWFVLLLAIVYLVSYALRKKRKIAIVSLIVFLFVGGTTLVTLFETKKESNDKLEQASMLLTTFSSDAYEVLPFSPKVRIEEFLDITKEIIEKPYYIFGKGFMGSIKDYSGYFGYYNEGAFHIEEYNNNSFVFLHESVNVLFLKFGIFGLAFIIYIIRISLKNCWKEPLLFIGMVWAVLFFNYSLSIALVGIPALILGLFRSEFKSLNYQDNLNSNVK